MPSSSASSNSTEVITNVVFGLTATVISIVTVWQGHRVWKMWREHGQGQGNVAADVELGLQPTPTRLEALEREEAVVASAPSSDHAEDVAGFEHTLVSTPCPQLQATLPRTVNVGPSFSPVLVQGAQTANDEHPGVHPVNVQPVVTDSERVELRPPTNGI